MTDEASKSVNPGGYEPRCKACNYPGHEEHDKTLLAGKLSDSDYAKIVGCASKSIARHRAHIVEEIAQSAKAQAVITADNLLDQLMQARQKAIVLLDLAIEAADTKVYGAPSTYLREIREQIKLWAELEGRLSAQRDTKPFHIRLRWYDEIKDETKYDS